MDIFQFIMEFLGDKDILRVVNSDCNNAIVYEGRSEILRNDFGDQYPFAFNTIVESVEAIGNVLVVYVYNE